MQVALRGYHIPRPREGVMLFQSALQMRAIATHATRQAKPRGHSCSTSPHELLWLTEDSAQVKLALEGTTRCLASESRVCAPTPFASNLDASQLQTGTGLLLFFCRLFNHAHPTVRGKRNRNKNLDRQKQYALKPYLPLIYLMVE